MKDFKEIDNGQIVIYQSEDGLTHIDVKMVEDTVWLTQAQMCELYQTSKSNLNEHIKHIFEEGELDEISVVRKFRITAADGKPYNVLHYNLDMIISLGYRVKSLIATRFRRWATERLKEYVVKGFTMDDERLKGHGGGAYWHELLDNILSSGGQALLSSGGQALLPDAGRISHDEAMEKATAEYRKWQAATLSPVEQAYLETIKTIEKKTVNK